MGTLDDYIYARARNALDGIAESDRREVYVVSFFVYDEDENPRKPTLTVGYNTESDVAAAREHPLVMDEAEARWCYAWYGEHALTVMFDSEKDQNGAKIRNRAIQMAGYTFQQDDAVATAITTPWFVANTVFAARRLHDRGDIARIFGRSYRACARVGVLRRHCDAESRCQPVRRGCRVRSMDTSDGIPVGG